MPDLSPELKGLVEATRAVESPTAEDRKRVRHGLAARIVGAVAAGAATTAATKAAASAAEAGAKVAAAAAVTAKTSAPLLGGMAKYVAVSLVVVGTAGTATVVALRTGEPPEQSTQSASATDDDPAEQKTSAQPKSKPGEAEQASSPEPVEEESSKASEKAATPQRAASAKPGANKLQRELSLLRSAQRALDSGQPGRALSILKQYAAEFPRGMMREEYHAVQIMALCAAGNRATAREAAQRFIKARPGSPLSKRIRTACGTIQPKD